MHVYNTVYRYTYMYTVYRYYSHVSLYLTLHVTSPFLFVLRDLYRYSPRFVACTFDSDQEQSARGLWIRLAARQTRILQIQGL